MNHVATGGCVRGFSGRGGVVHGSAVRPWSSCRQSSARWWRHRRPIVHGRVVDVRSYETAGRKTIESLVTVAGRRGDQRPARSDGRHFKLPGGQVGRYRRVMVGAPQFTPGDEVVLFLKGSPPAVPMPFGLTQGVYQSERVMPPAARWSCRQSRAVAGPHRAGRSRPACARSRCLLQHGANARGRSAMSSRRRRVWFAIAVFAMALPGPQTRTSISVSTPAGRPGRSSGTASRVRWFANDRGVPGVSAVAVPIRARTGVHDVGGRSDRVDRVSIRGLHRRRAVRRRRPVGAGVRERARHGSRARRNVVHRRRVLRNHHRIRRLLQLDLPVVDVCDGRPESISICTRLPPTRSGTSSVLGIRRSEKQR